MSPGYERIRRVVSKIPRGRVMTYGDVASAAGMPGAARQVGYALHSLGETVPWQRVLGRKNARSGQLTIKDPRARARQRRLLEKEGVRFAANGTVDLLTFGHAPRAKAASRAKPSALLAALALLACGSDGKPGAATGGSANAIGGSSATGGSSNGSGGATGVVTCHGEATSKGEATYYDFADGSGACGFDPSPNDLMVAAMNAVDYGLAAPCGACARVTGPNGEVTVRIVDLCPECPKGNIDLSPEAFVKIAPLAQGRVPIGWQYVPCNATGPVTYHFKDGSNQWWTAVQMRNHRHAIAKFEYRAAGSFVAIPRVDYNYFIAESGMGPGPYTFRVTDVHGAQLTDSGVTLGDNVSRTGMQQFPSCN